MTKEFQERRKFTRIKARNVIKCKKYTSTTYDKDLKTTMTKNFSAGGILIESKNKYTVGDVLTIELNLPGWRQFKSKFYEVIHRHDTLPLKIVGAVVRVEIISEGLYDIGITYSVIKEQDRKVLDKYIQRELVIL